MCQRVFACGFELELWAETFWFAWKRVRNPKGGGRDRTAELPHRVVGEPSLKGNPMVSQHSVSGHEHAAFQHLALFILEEGGSKLVVWRRRFERVR